MKLGFIILAHQNLHRVEELVRHLADQGCPSCIHIDKNVPNAAYDKLVKELAGVKDVIFSRRNACEWGRFSIVQASLDAADALFKNFNGITNVFLISGSCLPIRPIRQLHKFLQRNIHTDYIESVSVRNNLWVKGGLNEERFTLYFPFSWRKQRWVFDRFVSLQRKLRIERKLPDGLIPHIGSQWWCLTARTLRKILNDPRRPHYDSYFRASWIPDESYFQTLARVHAKKIESRSLTFSKFDFMGKPFNFYDDQLETLSQSDCFMGRKIWAGADKLYQEFLNPKRPNQPMTKANPKALIELFEQSDRLRCEGGEGRFHQGRFPLGQAPGSGVSQGEYTVFVGFKNLYEDFPEWLEKNTKTTAHGSIFDRRTVCGKSQGENFAGNLPAETAIRNRNTKAYLANFLWESRNTHQSLLYDFRDTPDVFGTISYDKKATVVMVRHSWLLLLLSRSASFGRILATAQKFHELEQEVLNAFSKIDSGSRLKMLELDTAVYSPSVLLGEATAHIGRNSDKHLQILPKLQRLDGLEPLIRKLRNKGLKIKFEHARQTKDTKPVETDRLTKPYVVK